MDVRKIDITDRDQFIGWWSVSVIVLTTITFLLKIGVLVHTLMLGGALYLMLSNPKREPEDAEAERQADKV